MSVEKKKLQFQKLIRFIKSDKEKIWELYKTVPGYQMWRDEQMNFMLGIPKGDKIANIGITAHYDTYDEAGFYAKTKFDKEDNKRILWDKTRSILFGKIYGDDRAGCYAVYDIMLTAEYKPYVLLFDGEESGLTGSDFFTENYQSLIKELQIPLMDKINFFIALDREGVDDAVYYTSDNPKFQKFIEQFGFKEQIGSFSDVKYLEEEYQKCGVNLSIGYQNNHSDWEILSVAVLRKTISKVVEICNKVGVKNSKFDYVAKKISYYTYNSGYDYQSGVYRKNNLGYLDHYNSDKLKDKSKQPWGSAINGTGKQDYCNACGKRTHVKEVYDKNQVNTYFLCKKCRKKMRKNQLDIPGLKQEMPDYKPLTGEETEICDDCGKEIRVVDGVKVYGDYFVCERCAEDMNEYMDSDRTVIGN